MMRVTGRTGLHVDLSTRFSPLCGGPQREPVGDEGKKGVRGRKGVRAGSTVCSAKCESFCVFVYFLTEKNGLIATIRD